MGRVSALGRQGRRPLGRVAVVAEFNLTGDSLRVALSRRGFQVMGVPLPGSTAEIRELGMRLRAFSPHAAVLLQELPEPVQLVSAMRTLAELREHRWLLLTGTPPGPEWGGGLASGASAVMSLTTSLETLAAALSRLCRGESVMSQADRDALIEEWMESSASRRALMDRLTTLTPRELEVLQELRAGRTVTEIAETGGVTIGTVRSQVKAILRKLDVSSQLAAVAVLQHATSLGHDEGLAPGPSAASEQE
ncbi:LuxR C-terminal-related transcriptional regulator [Nocardioides panacisoli]|uniref:helix-turn-helix transcriptional regulator n=1 Tax=Nocardioides panacisoli TaxID=627624 RepID=UPI001C6259F6|nr:LuxR C-terminal-related transcriptional regulator [Nocardioides panacisoli]QYJ04218.1 LuxR C-terminal-related transcriptional regulator [Nocardioides panacisoli]